MSAVWSGLSSILGNRFGTPRRETAITLDASGIAALACQTVIQEGEATKQWIDARSNAVALQAQKKKLKSAPPSPSGAGYDAWKTLLNSQGGREILQVALSTLVQYLKNNEVPFEKKTLRFYVQCMTDLNLLFFSLEPPSSETTNIVKEAEALLTYLETLSNYIEDTQIDTAERQQRICASLKRVSEEITKLIREKKNAEPSLETILNYSKDDQTFSLQHCSLKSIKRRAPTIERETGIKTKEINHLINELDVVLIIGDFTDNRHTATDLAKPLAQLKAILSCTSIPMEQFFKKN
jgi:hypothetical protein